MIDTRTDIKDIALRSMEIMRDGTYDDFVEVIHAEAVNHESKDEPPATRGRGPAAFYATALWLRDAFADLDFEVHTVVAEEDLVVIHNTMTGVHARAFVGYKPDGTVDQAFPPTGRSFASTQRTGCACATARSSSTGRTATTWAPRSSSAGSRPLPPTSCGWRARRARRASRTASSDPGDG